MTDGFTSAMAWYPLARPVRERLRAYLDYREDHRPGTAKPHLFIHYRTATHTGGATAYWVRARLGMSPQHICQERILDKAHATRGDVWLICDREIRRRRPRRSTS
jgi:hypothetical protein